jgi:PAS domain S-box-containing protein
MNTDIENRKRAENAQKPKRDRIIRQQEATLTLLREPFVSLQVALRRITEIVAETLEVERVSIWTFSENRAEIQCRDLFHLAERRHEQGAALAVTQYPRYFAALEDSLTIAAEDARADPRTSEFTEGYLSVLGISSMMDAPIRHRAMTLGVLCHEHVGAPREWTLDEQNFAGWVAEMVSLAFETSERKRAEEALRQSEDRLRLAIDTIPVMVTSTLVNGSADFLNKRWREYTGLPLREGLDYGWTTVIHPDDLAAMVEAWRSAVVTGVPFAHESRVRRADGTYRWFLVRGEPVRDERGNIVKWYGTTTDIEDGKQAEEIRTAQARQAGVRADVSAAFSKPGHLRKILFACAEAIVRHLDAAFARIWTLNEDGNVLELQASAGIYTRLDGSHSRISVGDLKVGWIAREKTPHLTNDVLNDPHISDKDWAQAGGFVSFAGYPLIVEERVVGVMALFARHPLWETTLGTLASVADTIAQGIQRKWAEEKLRQDEIELLRITDAIPQPICVLGPGGKVVYANQSVLDYSGLSVEDVMADDFHARLFHPDDLERLRDERRNGLECAVPFELELRARRKDKQYRWFLIRYNPLRDEQGRITRWYATGTDIEDRKQAEERIRNENLALREEIDHSSMFEEIVGSSEALRKVLAQVAKVAPVDSTVLILGETGTGKELIARAIHKRSNRSSRAFIRVNCAAIPPSLIASELFGHEKGAFTGALQRRLGRFELADGGTMLLDEIGDLPAETQIALLRVLQEREFERVGGCHPIPVNVRVLAATNRDLKTAVVTGAFRQDLFYRLNVFPIQVPSLRERTDDIPLLVEYFTERYAKKAGEKIKNIQKQTLELFQAYDWPGNIRELQNVIERAVVLCESQTFTVDETWLKPEGHGLSGPTVPFGAALIEREKEIIETALAACRGQVGGPSGAAAKLGIPRQTLESKVQALGIDKHRFRARRAG